MHHLFVFKEPLEKYDHRLAGTNTSNKIPIKPRFYASTFVATPEKRHKRLFLGMTV